MFFRINFKMLLVITKTYIFNFYLRHMLYIYNYSAIKVNQVVYTDMHMI